jgi:hypothetical protein
MVAGVRSCPGWCRRGRVMRMIRVGRLRLSARGGCGTVMRMSCMCIVGGGLSTSRCVSGMPLVSCRCMRMRGVVRMVIGACRSVVRSVVHVIHRPVVSGVVRAGSVCSMGITRIRDRGLPCRLPRCIVAVMTIRRSAREERHAYQGSE